MNDLSVKRAVDQAAREHWGYLYACLVKQFHVFDLAEDALQDAIISALETWQVDQLPNSPRAWLLQTAKRKVLDRLRRRDNFANKKESYALLSEQVSDHTADCPEQLADQHIEDERLKLIFTCCHPALPESAHVALTLRTLAVYLFPKLLVPSLFLKKP